MKAARSIHRAGRRFRPLEHHSSAPALEWVEDVSGRCARITAVGSRSLLVENHTGLCDYSETRVCLNSRMGPIRVTGSGLTLCDVRPGALIVRGRVSRVELPCEGGATSDEG